MLKEIRTLRRILQISMYTGTPVPFADLYQIKDPLKNKVRCLKGIH